MSATATICACCEVEPADVMLRIVFADSVDVSPWCMDCAADVVAMELATIERSIRPPSSGDNDLGSSL